MKRGARSVLLAGFVALAIPPSAARAQSGDAPCKDALIKQIVTTRLSVDREIRWRSDFKSDGATRFGEVAGGLNQMTVRRFQKLVEESEFEIERLETLPIRRLRFLCNRVTREFFTSAVRCRLKPRHRLPTT